MAPIDYIILLLYLLLLLSLGFMRSKRADKNLEEYVLAGRRLSLPAFVATLVTTWYGGILGVGEFSYTYGISNWLVFGVPYYLYAILFAFFLAGRARREKLLTIPEQLERAYGKTAGMIGALFVFILTTPAPYVLMLGVLCEILFGWQLWIGILAGTLLSMIYAFRGGFAAVVRTEMLQFVLMYAGFALILGFAIANYGGWEFLKRSLPASHFTWHGGNPPLYILVWYFIAMSTLVDPTFYQRCFAARDEKTARNGILISVLCWALFDFMTTASGLYARAIMPQLSNAVESYPQLAVRLLPPGVLGIFYVAMFAIVMSTVDGFSFTSAITIGKDFLAKLRRRETENALTQLTRLGLVLTFMVAVAIALWARSVVEIWYQLGTIATPALLLPLASSFSKKWRMRPNAVLFSMPVSAGLTTLWLFNQTEGKFWWGLEPIFPGLASAAIFFLWGRKASAKQN